MLGHFLSLPRTVRYNTCCCTTVSHNSYNHCACIPPFLIDTICIPGLDACSKPDIVCTPTAVQQEVHDTRNAMPTVRLPTFLPRSLCVCVRARTGRGGGGQEVAVRRGRFWTFLRSSVLVC